MMRGIFAPGLAVVRRTAIPFRSKATRSVVGSVAMAATVVVVGWAGASSAVAAPQATAASSSAGIAAARAFLAPFRSVGTSIGISVPLKAKPQRGMKVFAIENNDPTTAPIVQGLQAATKALGWTLKVLYFNGADPSDANGLIQEAVQQHANFITEIAVPLSTMRTGVAAAKAAHIPVFESFGSNAPTRSGNDLYSNVAGTSMYVTKGKINADYIISTLGDKANTLILSFPDFPVAVTWAKSAAAEFKKNCSACVTNILNVPYTDVEAGDAPADVVGYLRTHPQVNNVIFTDGDLLTGFDQQAKTGGLTIGKSGIILTDQNTEEISLQSILDGTEQMSLATGVPYTGWLLVDAMARYAQKMSLKPNWNTVIPQLLETKADVTSASGVYSGPANYQKSFERLWHVG
jgi:ABC-type sugar transport system substrate-binding protein